MARTKKNKNDNTTIETSINSENIKTDQNKTHDTDSQNLNDTNSISNSELIVPVKNKRGRKPKKIITENDIPNIDYKINDSFSGSTSISDSTNMLLTNNTNDIIISDNINTIELDALNDSTDNICDETCENNVIKTVGKKRGRKPKGGKIIQQIVPIINNKETKPNVILHLKCSLKDLNTSNIINNNIESYSFNNELNYEIITTGNDFTNNYMNNKINNKYNVSNNEINYTCDDPDDSDDYQTPKEANDMKDVWKKLKNLEHNLHLNNISNKKSACFWCTCDFDNPPVYIPKYFMKDSYHVYGCFCSPECATAYLMEENIDSSAKFERYHLINHIYAKVYDYTKNIKPAPNPYYMLDKFYGNLTIQEYRSLLKNERLFLVVDKPLTRIMPELHEDNDDFIMNNKIIPSNTYQIKKKMQKQTKTNILTEKFGLINH